MSEKPKLSRRLSALDATFPLAGKEVFVRASIGIPAAGVT